MDAEYLQTFPCLQDFGLDIADDKAFDELPQSLSGHDLPPLPGTLSGAVEAIAVGAPVPAPHCSASSAAGARPRAEPSIKTEPRERLYKHQPHLSTASDISPDFVAPSSPEDDAQDVDGCATPPQGQTPPHSTMRAVPARVVPPSAATSVPHPPPRHQPPVSSTAAPAATQASKAVQGRGGVANSTGGEQVAMGAIAYDADTIEANRAVRLKRNREAAQQFRKRKKEYFHSVERNAELLSEENMSLKARLGALEAENKLLREENAFYKSFVGGQQEMPLPKPTEPQLSASQGKIVNPRSKVAKLAAGSMCAMMMVMGVATLGEDQHPATRARGNGHLQPTTVRRQMLTDTRHNASDVVPLPGDLWPSGYSGNNVTQQVQNASVTWLSLTQPFHSSDGYGSSFQQQLASEMQNSFLHRGFLQRDGTNGLSVDWDMLARFGALSKPSTRYIFCPEAQQIPIPPSSGWNQPEDRRAKTSVEESPVEIQLKDDDDDPAVGTQLMKIQPHADPYTVQHNQWDNDLKPVPARATGATSHQHPPDLDPEDLDFASGRDSFAQDDSTEFGVSLLIPNGDNANETTSLGGVDVPSMQFLELRCSVINVTQRTFTM